MRTKRLSLIGLAAAALLAGCHSSNSHDSKAPDAKAMAVITPAKAAATMPSSRNVHGTVTLTQWGDTVEVYARIEGLTPNTEHGFHIHEFGDISAPDLMSAGGHWDPTGHHHHGAPIAMDVHAGDLGNLRSDADGVATLHMMTKAFSLTKEPSAIGHALIIHVKMDDFVTQPTGNSGGRVAGGVIQKQ